MRDGSDYLKSLKARSCAIYIGGERVNDATSHPAFANAAATAANLYDTTADPANAGCLTHQIPRRRDPLQQYLAAAAQSAGYRRAQSRA